MDEAKRISAGFNWTPTLGDLRSLSECIDFNGNNQHIMDRYERSIECELNIGPTVAFSSGTASLLAAYVAANVGEGDEVIVSPLAPSPTVLPMLVLGARPVFVDVQEPNSFMLCSVDIERTVSSKTKAIVDVPMWGAAYRSDKILSICHRYGIPFIQDLSQCHGTYLGVTHIGADADIACFSTQARKILATGEGGFAVARNSLLRTKLTTFRDYGQKGNGYSEQVGLNLRMGWPSALIGIAACDALKTRVAIRRKNADALRQKLEGVKNIEPWTEQESVSSSYYGFPISIKQQKTTARIIGGKLNNIGVETDTHRYRYDVLYRRKLFERYYRECKRAEQLANELITLPCHDGISGEAISLTAEVLDSVVNEY